MTQTIESFKELVHWNEHPTKELPILMDWYFDWLFDEILVKDDYSEFLTALHHYIIFDINCNNLGYKYAKKNCIDNIRYVNGRFSKDSKNLLIFLKKFEDGI